MPALCKIVVFVIIIAALNAKRIFIFNNQFNYVLHLKIVFIQIKCNAMGVIQII